MLWFNFILGSNFILLIVYLNSLSYITIAKNKGKLKFEPRIKLIGSGLSDVEQEDMVHQR